LLDVNGKTIDVLHENLDHRSRPGMAAFQFLDANGDVSVP